MIDSKSTESMPVIPEFIASKITDRKLNGDNYIQWRKIVEINLIGHEKKLSFVLGSSQFSER